MYILNFIIYQDNVLDTFNLEISIFRRLKEDTKNMTNQHAYSHTDTKSTFQRIKTNFTNKGLC